jgi:outer membrane protein assembly factor BamB
MKRRGFPITGSIIFAAGVVLGLAAFGADTSSPRRNPNLPEFTASAGTHVTRADSQGALNWQNAREIPAQTEVGPPQTPAPAPPTRSSFMASWQSLSGATGYLLDVSTSGSFTSYVNGYQDLDVGNVTGQVVTGLSQGTTYYYRVRAYDATGTTSGDSNVMTATTAATIGLIINPTFDSSITTRANAATIEAMINRAISIYESLFSDPITVKILFRYSTTAPNGSPFPSGALSESNWVYYTVPWNTYINALVADAITGYDTTANTSLPAAALSTNIRPSSANGRAVSLNTPPAMFANGAVGGGGTFDGIVSLNSAAPLQLIRPTSASNYDAQRQTEHEIDEVLGLGSRLSIGGSDLRPQDLFSWSSAGVRNLTSSGTRYFSINRGSTSMVSFNQTAPGDFGDWLSTACPQAHPYVQNAFSCPGQFSDVTLASPEGINLDVIGYDLVHAIVTTTPATNVASFSATLNGTVNPDGLTTTVHFQYGTTTNYGSVTANQNYSGNTTQNVSANISGLSASTTYHFRVVATSSTATTYGSDKTFTTLSVTGPPVVTTNPASYIASFSATLNGTVDPHGLTTTVYFQYGATTSYGLTTATQSKTGNTYQNVAANISGLTASTTYHFRIVAINGAGTVYGPDRTFTTLSATGPPVVITNPATNVGSSSATLNGTVDPHGLTTTVYFQYGTTTSYGHTTATQSKAGNTYQNVTANISGLTASTTYHFRMLATNSAGTAYGSDRTFTTFLLDDSVAWQNNTAHDGFDPASRLVTPLTSRWRRDLSASGVTSISYPLIAQGLVFVTTTTTNQVERLMALDEHTGATIWSAGVDGTYSFANAAYDSGKVFVVNYDGLMKAFDAATGTLLWSVGLPGQYAFTSPPTAVNGIVLTGGAGSGGTVYAVNETNGAVLWMMPVANGDHSSPAVVSGKVFVSYACAQAYAFNAVTGQQLWHHSSCCEGGGGKTPVVHAGQVYVRDSSCTQTNGLVLDATTGATIRGFNSDQPPAFFGNLALFLQSGTLRGVDSTTGQVLWSFAGDGGLTAAPLVVNQTIYIGSSSGTLYGLNASGQQIWSTQVGAAIPAPDEQNATLTTGLGAGDGLLVVPAGGVLAAYGN